MGIYDRDYYRQPTRTSGIPAWSVTTWLIIINVAVFVIDSILQNPLRDVWGYFSIDTAFVHMQAWRLITFQFLHQNIGHIFYNMLALYSFGPIVEETFGPRKYLALYLISGVTSALMFVILCFVNVLGDNFVTGLIGASGCVFGVLVAAAVIAPDMVMRIEFIIPMKLKTVAMLMVAVAIYTVATSGHNAGGEAGHIGGAIMGFILVKNPRLLDFAAYRRPRNRMRYRR